MRTKPLQSSRFSFSGSTVAYGMLAFTLLTAPILLAANRPVFWLTYTAILAVASAVWAFTLCKEDKPETLCISTQQYWPVIATYGAVLLWCIIQFLPMPYAGMAHPLWHSASNILSIENTASITIDRYESMDGFIRLCGYAAAFLLAMQLGRKTENAEKLLKLILFTCLGCSIYGLLMYMLDIEKVLWVDKLMYKDSLCGTFINRNSFATYTGLGLIISCSYFIRLLFERTKGLYGKSLYHTLLHNFFSDALIYGLMIGIFFTALLLTHSRAGMISTLVAFAALFALLLTSKNLKGRRMQLLVVIATLTVLLTWMLGNGGDRLFERFVKLSEQGDLRTAIYAVSWQAIKENLWLGTGINTFEKAFSLYRDAQFPFKWASRVDKAHNTYLQTLLELGLPAFCCFMATYIWIVIRLIKGYFSRKRNGHFALIALASVILFGVHALVDFSLEMPAMAITFATLLGIGVAQSWSSRENLSASGFSEAIISRNTLYIISGAGSFLALFAVLLLPNAVLKYRSATVLFNINMTQYVPTETLNDTLSHYQNALPSHDGELYMDASLLSLTDATRYGAFSDYGTALLNQARGDLKEGLALSPVDTTGWARLAYVELLLEGPDKLVADALYMSALTGPYQAQSFYNRLSRIPLIWDIATSDQKQLFLNQIAYAWSQGKQHVFKVLSSTIGLEMLKLALINDPGETETLDEMIQRQQNNSNN